MDILDQELKHLKISEDTTIHKVLPQGKNRLVIYEDRCGSFHSEVCRPDGRDADGNSQVVTYVYDKEYRYKTIEEFLASGYSMQEVAGRVLAKKDDTGSITLNYYKFGMRLPDPVESYPTHYLDWFCVEMDR